MNPAESSAANPAPLDTLQALSATLELLPTAACFCDHRGEILKYNAKSIEILGRPPKGSDQLFEEIMRVGVGTVNSERIIKRSGGSTIRLLTASSALLDADGRFIGALSALMVAPPSLLEQVAEAVPQMVWITDADGKTEYVNRRWTEFTGMDLAATLEKGWAASIHPEDVQRAYESWNNPRASGEALECEVRYRNAVDGGYRHYLVRAVPLQDSEGRINRWLGASTDIHVQNELLGQVKDALAARDEFLSIASHELRTPLTSLYLQLEMMSAMADPTRSAESLRGDLRTCVSKAEKIATLLDELLDLTQIRLGRLTLNRIRVRLASLVEDVLSRADTEIRRSGSKVTLDLDPAISGEWDPSRIGQLVFNLLTNALKYGEGGPIYISARLSEGGDRALIQVCDRGMGISKEMQARIFERFERCVSGRNIAGMGLGLYIVNQIVKAHGGSIQVESAPGQGAVFSVELPVRG